MSSAQYFSYFPKTLYDANCGSMPYVEHITVTDITKRFRVLPELLSRSVLYYTYEVQDEERADVIAHKFYQNSQLDWIVMLTNSITDPTWQWPMGYNDFIAFVENKYGTLRVAQHDIHHYEQVLQEAETLNDGTIIPEQTVNIDYTTYLSLPTTETKAVSYYDYEDGINEARRSIKIIRQEFLSRIINEATTVLKK
jgi:hypothetical protein